MFYFEFKIEKAIIKNETSLIANGLSTRNNFPKGLRGGGPCFDW